MTSSMDTNGDTASLKRKRGPRDELPPAQKKHRRRSKAQLEDTGTLEDATGDKTTMRQVNGHPGPTSAILHHPPGSSREKLASWKVSKPMGGRMLDIDPIFSPDER